MSNIEEHVRQAMQEGKFDNLKGRGKKLSLDDNPLADPEWRLAYHVLQSSGFTLPWIETRQQIEQAIAVQRSALHQAWEWRTAAMANRQQSVDLILAEWERVEKKFRHVVVELNKQIRAFNLTAPTEQVHLPILNPERELARLREQGQGGVGE